jgi:hypothetical protein
MSAYDSETVEPESLDDPQTSRRILLRNTLLTLGIFIPLLGAFLTGTEWYPISHYKMFYGASALQRGDGINYFILRGETAAGNSVDIAPIKIMNALDDRIWTMVNSVIANESFELRWPHPANERLLATTGNSDTLSRGVLLPDLLRTWGNRYNAKLPHDSPQRLVRVRLDKYRWSHKEYANYSEFVESWRVDL